MGDESIVDLKKRLADSLEEEQTRRMLYLDSLQRRLEENQRDGELQELCQEVDKKEQEKANLKTVLGELEQMRAALASATERERELFVPQQYEATFERKLYRHTLGLDIRLTQDRLISLVFTRMDPSQPERQFRVTLDVSDTGHWEVVSLDPHVHGVESLQQRLNSETGSITQFCKAFRKECKQFIQSHDH